MKTTIVLAVLLAATPAFAQYGYGPPSQYGYGPPNNGATMQDYRLAPHQRTTRQRRPLRMQTAAPTQKSPECNMPFKKWSTNWAEYYHCYQ
jgi:hypothetical protein